MVAFRFDAAGTTPRRESGCMKTQTGATCMGIGTGRVAVVLNPSSGSADSVEEITAKIRESIPQAEIMTGAEAGDAERAAAAAQSSGCETVIAAGGDGTLNEVLNGCLAALSLRLTVPP